MAKKRQMACNFRVIGDRHPQSDHKGAGGDIGSLNAEGVLVQSRRPHVVPKKEAALAPEARAVSQPVRQALGRPSQGEKTSAYLEPPKSMIVHERPVRENDIMIARRLVSLRHRMMAVRPYVAGLDLAIDPRLKMAGWNTRTIKSPRDGCVRPAFTASAYSAPITIARTRYQ